MNVRWVTCFFLVSSILTVAVGCRHEAIAISASTEDGTNTAHRAELIQLAKKGDARAAYLLCADYADESDLPAHLYWARVAALLGDANAMVVLASDIKSGRCTEYQPFASTREGAVLALLKKASTESVVACAMLAHSFEAGFFGTPDPTNAVWYYREAARLGDTVCWPSLARLLAASGSLADTEQAYYWCSMSTRTTSPESGTGQEMWPMRLDLTAKLSLPVLEALWQRSDRDIDEIRSGRRHTDPQPFYFGHGNAEAVMKEGFAETDRMEEAYRARVRSSHRDEAPDQVTPFQ